MPRNEFEREALRRLKSGLSWYDEVCQLNGQRVLRAATPVTVVLQKCAMCHPHYKDAKPGEAIGLLSYTIRVE